MRGYDELGNPVANIAIVDRKTCYEVTLTFGQLMLETFKTPRGTVDELGDAIDAKLAEHKQFAGGKVDRSTLHE